MSENWFVMKFGGTSVSSPALWQEIIRQASQRKNEGYNVLIVVSAIRGVTDALSGFMDTGDASQSKALGEQVLQRYDAVRAEARTQISGLEQQVADAFVRHLASATEATLAQPEWRAELLAFGERLCSAMGAAIFNAQSVDIVHTDARDLLTSDPGQGNAAHLSATCSPKFHPEVAKRLANHGSIHLTQGFTARNAAGNTVVLGRGGSDTTAAYMGALLNARRVEIWTDVPGMFTANPAKIPGARLLKRLSYREAQELASMGAKVLHPRCLTPLREAGIELAIRQTSRPEISGTIIAPNHPESAAQVKAIAQRGNITLIVMEGLAMWQQVGFLSKAFAVFARHGLSIDLISTSEANITVSLDLDEQLLDEAVIRHVLDELGEMCQVRLISHCASVSLVGLGIRTIMHRLGPALEVFEQRRIYLVTQAANDLNLTFVVEAKHADRLVQQLHQTLIPGGVGGDSHFGPTWEQLFNNVDRPKAVEPWWKGARERLLHLADEHPSAYVYCRSRLQENARRLTRLSNVDRIFYAMKANCNVDVLRTFHEEGLGFECVSPGEIRLLQKLFPDLDKNRILYTPNFAPREDYAFGMEHSGHLTIDNLYVLENWGDTLAGGSVFLRIDPGSGLGHHKLVRTAGVHSKFGIPPQDLKAAAGLIREYGIRVTGLHAHTGSGIMHPDAWQRTLAQLSELLEMFPTVRHIDMGGGLGVPDKIDDLPLDLEALNRAIGEIHQHLPQQVELWLEPGRYLVADAGVLLARVTQLKGKGEVRYVGTTTGMNSLIRPALYGAFHEIRNLTRLDEPGAAVCNVVGPICETGDILGMDRLLPECHEGDILLINNAGAYGQVMASHYNLRDPATELFLT